MTAVVHGPGPGAPAAARPAGPTARPAATRPTVKAGSAEEYLTVVGTVLSVIALASLWAVLQLSVLSAYSEQRAQHVLYPQLRSSLANAVAPTGGRIAEGTPVAVLSIPDLGTRSVVVEGTTGTQLRGGPGHRRDTVLPGQAGISVVAGRAATYGGPFARIPSLRAGQQIVVQMGEGRLTYTVRDVRRAGDPVPPAPTGAGSQLVLVTAEGAGPLASLHPLSVVYVDAYAPKGFAAGGGRPTGVSAAELPMGSDRSALPLLALSLAVLIGVCFVAVAEWNRRSKVLVWVVTAPVVMAVAWFTVDVAVRLLPNLV